MQLAMQRSTFWYPVVTTETEFKNLPWIWRNGVQFDSFDIFRAKQLEMMEAFAHKNGCELIVVRTTPSYMMHMLGSNPDTIECIKKVCRLIANMPEFDTNKVYGE